MSVCSTSVRRPIGISMVFMIIVLFGAISLYHLPVDLMPDITYPTISLSATYANSSPVEVETMITRPIEQALSAVPGVEEISSTSSEGRSQVRVTFAWGTDLDAAASDIRDRLDRIIARLPEGIERPTLRKFDLANFPILVIGASSNLDPVQLLKVMEEQVKYRIERIPGVAALDISGGNKREIQVYLDIARLKALNLRPEQIIERLRQENLNLPAGLIETGNYEFTVRTPGEFYQIDQIGQVVVKEDGAARIRLAEVARIEDHWEKVRQIVRVNGQPGVRLQVSKQSGRNTVQVAKAVLAEMAAINRDLPQVKLTPIVDSSKYIQQSITDVASSALQGGLLAVLVLLFFLGELRSTLVVGLSIPLSIVATFALMYAYGFTLNLMSLGGLALGVGMLVDNAIVVLENIYRLRELGKDATTAAIEGSDEVAAPILASTLTTVVIFLPLLFVEGMTGLMFQQLAWVVGFSLMCSLVVSVTLVPMLCAQLLKSPGETRPGLLTRLLQAPQPLIRFLEARYLEILGLALRWRLTALLLVALALAGSLWLARTIPSEFLPAADEGEVQVNLEMEVGTRLGLMGKKLAEVEALVARLVPEAQTIVANAGSGGGGPGGGGGRGGGSSRGSIRIPLVPRAQRKRSSTRIAAELRPALAGITGARIRVREGQGLFIFRLGSQGTDRVQVQVRGHNFERADQLARRVQKLIEDIPGITDVQLSREAGVPEKLISIDRQRAADQRFTVSRIAAFLETMLSGSAAGNYREGGDEYRILVKAAAAERLDLEQILDLVLLNNLNQPVVLRNVAQIISRIGPQLIERQDQERVVNVTADPGERPLGAVLAEVRDRLATLPVPDGFSVLIAGDYEEQQKANVELAISFALALVLVFMVMAVQYESLLDPLVVMVTVPLSAIGVVVALLLTGTTFNVQAFIGCIMLGGIVVNNSILLVDHTNLLHRERGVELFAALREAGRDRFRPVLMTALTTILGLIPLALGLGEGGEVQAPLARVVIGGLTCATVISLVIIPVVLSFVARLTPPPALAIAPANGQSLATTALPTAAPAAGPAA